MLIEAEVTSFALDQNRNTPVLVLKEVNGSRVLPVPIAPLEASTIAMETLSVTPEKPLTIDLLKLVMEQLGGELQRVVISNIIEQSLYARVHLKSGNGISLIECRPSDAIALALRCKVSIFIEDHVLDQVNSGSATAKEQLKKRISSIDTIEFGKYYLE